MRFQAAVKLSLMSALCALSVPLLSSNALALTSTDTVETNIRVIPPSESQGLQDVETNPTPSVQIRPRIEPSNITPRESSSEKSLTQPGATQELVSPEVTPEKQTTTQDTPRPSNQETPLTETPSVPAEQEVAFPVAPSSDPAAVQSHMKSIVVPADTVVYVSLDQKLDSDDSQAGQPVSASVIDPVYLGPYLAIPAQSKITGAVTAINKKKDEEGRNPYIVVHFNTIKLPSMAETLPFSGQLIAYKTGLRGEEYVWRLPTKQEEQKKALRSVIGGAFGGIMLNPIFGPLLGAGTGLLKNVVVDSFARGGDVEIEPNEPVSISIGENIWMPVEDPFAGQNPSSSGVPEASTISPDPASTVQDTAVQPRTLMIDDTLK